MFHALDADQNATHSVAGHRRVRDVPRAGQRERRVDLVGEHQHAVPAGELGHRPQLVQRPHPAERVVRGAEQVRPRAGAERGRQPVEVEGPAGAVPGERHLDHPAPGLRQVDEERRVDGRVDHHRAAGLAGRPQHLDDADHDVRDQVHVRRVDGPAVPLRDERGEGRRQRPRLGVAEVAGLDRVVQGALHRVRERDVQLGHERGQHVRRVRHPLGAAPPAQVGQRHPVEVVVIRHTPILPGARRAYART